MAGTQVDYDPFDQAASPGDGTPVEHNPFASTTASEKTLREKSKEGSDVGYAATRGLVKGILGGPGEVEHLLVHTIPEYVGLSKPTERGKFLGRETLFPTTEEVSKGMAAIGIPEPEAKYSSYETAGEFAPAALGLGKLATDGIGSLGKSIKKAKDFYELSKGKSADELANLLRTKLSGKAEEVISGAKSAQAEPTKKIEAVGKAQQELGGRGKVASKRQVAREKEVQSSLDTLSKDKNVLAEDVGGAIQPQGQANLEKMRAARTQEAITKVKDPAFEQARGREDAGDFLSTNPKSQKEFGETLQEIQTQIERTPEPYRSELKKRLGSLRGEEVALTEAEKRGEAVRAAIEGRPANVTKFKPMTLDQAEFMRRILKDKNLGEAIGAKGMDVSRMNTLGDKLLSAMNAYEPRIAKYIEKYKEGSEPITRALAGRGKAMTEMEIAAEENALFSSDKKAAADYYLNGTQERAQRLLDLVGGKKAQVVDKIKGYFRTQMEGMNSAQAKDFIAKQEGFLRVFPELRDSMNKVAEAKGIAETAGVSAEKRAVQAATRLSGEEKVAQTAAEKSKAIEDTYRQFKTRLEAMSPRDSITEARSVADKLRKEGYIDDAAYSDVLREIEQVKQVYKDTAEAKTAVDTLVKRTLWQAFGYGTLAGAGYYLYKEK